MRKLDAIDRDLGKWERRITRIDRTWERGATVSVDRYLARRAAILAQLAALWAERAQHFA